MNKHKMHIKKLIKTMLNQSHKQSGKRIIIKIKIYSKNLFGKKKKYIYIYIYLFIYFTEFQPMTSTLDNSFLSSNQDTNQFFGVSGD